MQQFKFQTKVINWIDSGGENHTNKIILQNQNGPCFVISLINNIILSQELKDSKGWHVVGSSTHGNTKIQKLEHSNAHDASQTAAFDDNSSSVLQATDVQNLNELLARNESVSLNSLLDELTNILFTVNERCSSTLGGPVIDMEAVMNTLPLIESGLNVNLQLDRPGINDFADFTPIVNNLLNIFDIKIVHGFIAEEGELSVSEREIPFDKLQEIMVKALESHPELDDYKGIEEYKNKKHNEVDFDVVEQYFRLKRLLEKNKTQLTRRGIEILKNDNSVLKDNQFGIFFRNDHFNTIYKAEGNIYLLVNDEGFKDEPEIIWQVLAGINGGKDEFLTGNFEVPNPALLEKNAARRLKNPDARCPTDDEILAKQLQQEEDAKISRSLQNKYDAENKQVELRKKRQTKRKRGKEKHNQKRKGGKTGTRDNLNVGQGLNENDSNQSNNTGCVVQ